MIRWLASRTKLFWLVLVRRKLAAAMARLDVASACLAARVKELKRLERKVVMLTESVAEDLVLAEKAKRQVVSAMEIEREKAQIYEDVTIPTLLAQHKLVLARYEAETAIAVRNQTIAQMTRGEER